MARRGKQTGEPTDWVTRAADDAIRHAEQHNPGGIVTCASGISPSGPIHLGNLREFLTVHFVAEEIRRRGVEVRHLQSWDDYDRFRKVPAGVDPAWNDNIGRPLSAVPDPWECHASWAEHFKQPLLDALTEMGCEMVQMHQTEKYRAGEYREQILHVVRNRHQVDEVLGRYRTKAAPGSDNAQEAAELADSVAFDDESTAAGRGSDDLARFPFKPYCRDCGRDTTTITAYDDDTTVLDYTCQACTYSGSTNLSTDNEGKLVWKVDWPMRWAYEKVNFEPAGADHSSPGSSFTVGHQLVESLFDWPRPTWFGYSFVGFAGMAKMSSSKGGVPTALEALRVLEAPILRWLYVRRRPNQAFDVDFGPDVVRLYDEWDALGRKAADPAKRDAHVLAFERASATTTAGRLPTPEVAAPFRLLSSVADVTAGSAEQISRIVDSAGYPHRSVEELEPRLSRAMTWMQEYVPAEDRTTVRQTPDTERLAALAPHERQWLDLLLAGIDEADTVDRVTALTYGVPKLARGLELDAAPTDEIKADQKAFFGLLYRLLVDADRGPRLPTLLLALGPEQVRRLLTAA